jgi:phage head maturation protease
MPIASVQRAAMDSRALTWKFVISDETPDLMNDVIKLDGWRLQNFGKNGVVLSNHDHTLPVGQSSLPYVSNKALMAAVTFPEAGISATSDQVRGMIAAGVLRGASVGFVPGKIAFSKDPQRPLGIDFLDGHQLTEWSCVSVPANPNCLVVGPTSAKSISQDAVAARKSEARSIISLVKGQTPRSAQTREQRIAEARRLRALIDAR